MKTKIEIPKGDAKNKKWIDKSGFVDSDCTDEVSEWRPLPEPPKSK